MDSGPNGIYRPPASNLDPYERAPGEWGSVERALRGDFEFDMVAIFNDARDLLYGSKGVVLGSLLIQGAVNVVAQRSIESTFGSPDELGEMVVPALLSMAPSLITAPITAGVMMYAIKRAAADPSASFNDVFGYYDRFFKIAGLTILQTMLIGLGFLFFILPGIYLALAYGLAMPLMLEKQMPIWEALETSRRSLTHCWFRLFGFWLLVALGASLGAMITLGIGLVWIIPLAMLCVGVTYRNIFGYEGPGDASGGLEQDPRFG